MHAVRPSKGCALWLRILDRTLDHSVAGESAAQRSHLARNGNFIGQFRESKSNDPE